MVWHEFALIFVTQAAQCITISTPTKAIVHQLSINVAMAFANTFFISEIFEGYRGFRMAKVMIIACFIIVGVIVIVTILVVMKVKR